MKNECSIQWTRGSTGTDRGDRGSQRLAREFRHWEWEAKAGTRLQGKTDANSHIEAKSDIKGMLKEAFLCWGGITLT